ICGTMLETFWPPMVVPESDEPLLEEGLWAVLLHLLPPLALYTIPIVVILGGFLFFLLLGGLRVLSALALPQYLAAPWCFKCKYPVPGSIDGRPCPNCPECGEPILREIAALAAERGT